VAPGIVVENETEEVTQVRKDMLDMLFVEGNHFCPSCDKSGDCELQALAYRLGIAAPRFPYLWNKRDVDASHPDVYIDRDRYTILPNTAGCYTAEDAVRTCRLARELLDGHDLVKLEVLGDEKTLFPDIVQTIAAAETLIKDGFKVMVYTNDDPIIAQRFEDMGCVAVMPLAAPIGSGLGIRNPYNILTIVENATVPILVDAGVGTASDAAIAMELGCDGVLMNTAIAGAKDPVLMASAMKKAIEAGREAFRAGRIPRKRFASASSPIDGTFF